MKALSEDYGDESLRNKDLESGMIIIEMSTFPNDCKEFCTRISLFT